MATIADMANLRLGSDAAKTVTLEEQIVSLHEKLVDWAVDNRWERTTIPLAGNITGYVGKLAFTRVAAEFLEAQGLNCSDDRFELIFQALVDAGSRHALFRMAEPGRTGSYTNRALSARQLTTPQTWVVAAELPKSLTNRKKRPHSPMTTNVSEKTVTEKKAGDTGSYKRTPGVKPPWFTGGRAPGARNKATISALGLVTRILEEGGRTMTSREIFDAAPVNLWPFSDVGRMPRLLEVGASDNKFYVRGITAEDIEALDAQGVPVRGFRVGVTLVACAKRVGVSDEQAPGRKKTPPQIRFADSAEEPELPDREAVEKADREFLESPEVRQSIETASKAAKETVLGVVQGGDDLMERAQKALEASQASLEAASKVKALEDEVKSLKAENKSLRKMVDDLIATNEALRGGK